MRQYDIEDPQACKAELEEMERRHPRIVRRYSGVSPADEKDIGLRTAALVRFLREYPRYLKWSDLALAEELRNKVLTGYPDEDLQDFVRYNGGTLLADKRMRQVVKECKSLATSVALPTASRPQNEHDR